MHTAQFKKNYVLIMQNERGSEGRLGSFAPPLGVGVTARREGALTQSREGLAGSPDQVVGHGPVV